jgi:hypothetical protein
MADTLDFLTHALGGTFYSYLDTVTVASLCGTNKVLCENIVRHVTECKKMRKRAYPRSAYFENKDGCGFMTYTTHYSVPKPAMVRLGSAVCVKVRPCKPTKFLSTDTLVIKQGIIVDPYCVTVYDYTWEYDCVIKCYMTRHEALAIRDAFRWWHDRKKAIAEQEWREEA